jgi:hypothetical protein
MSLKESSKSNQRSGFRYMAQFETNEDGTFPFVTTAYRRVIAHKFSTAGIK